jgi:O-antigen ligase
VLSLLIGYVWLFIHRPFEVWPFLGDLRIELIYVLFVVCAWAAYPGKAAPKNCFHFALAFFVLAMILCTATSPNAWEGLVVLEGYYKLVVFYLLVVTIVRDEWGLRRLTLALLVTFALYMLHSLWEYHNGRCVARMGIVRLVGVDSSYSDPNAFASSILLAATFVPAVWSSYPSRRVRWFLVAFLAEAMVCITYTGSRGAFVGAVLLGSLWVAQSKRRAMVAALAPVLAVPLFLMLPEKLQNRFESIIFPEVGPANAKVSADTRIEGLLIGLQLWQDHPATGIGPGAWRAFTGRKLQAHNLYGQLLGEMGTLGALAFLGILAAFAANVWKIERLYRAHPHWPRDFLFYFNRAIGTAVFLLLFEGNFGHNLYRYNWVWFGAFLCIARACVERRLHEEVEVGPIEESPEPGFDESRCLAEV